MSSDVPVDLAASSQAAPAATPTDPIVDALECVPAHAHHPVKTTDNKYVGLEMTLRAYDPKTLNPTPGSSKVIFYVCSTCGALYCRPCPRQLTPIG